MSRRTGNGDGQSEHQSWTQEEALAVEQSLDMQMIEHVKELLCTLWKQSRIVMDVRTQGEIALSAALRAIENPSEKNLTMPEGMKALNASWLRLHRSGNHDF